MIDILYNVEHREAAGVLIAIYFYLTGISAGSFILSTLAYVFGQAKYKPIGKIAVVLATAVLIIAPMALLIHVGRPFRAWRLFYNINFTSPISWGSFLLTLYPINCIIYGYFIFKNNAKMTKLFGTIGIPLAVSVHGYCGFILGFAKARHLWNTALMPILFLVSAIVSGIALGDLCRLHQGQVFLPGTESERRADLRPCKIDGRFSSLRSLPGVE